MEIEDKISEPIDDRIVGGQQCGMPVIGWRIKSSDLGILIEVKSFRQTNKNRELAEQLFELSILGLKN